MRATTLLAVFALGCLSLSAVTEATAQSYYWHEGTANPAKASHVLRYSYNQPCQTLHKYRAHNLSLNADTVMHLTVGNPPNEIAWNDNFQGGSQITYFTGCTSGSETITIWVRAVSNMAGGDPDLNYTYTFTHERLTSPAAVISTSNNVPLGGWILSAGKHLWVGFDGDGTHKQRRSRNLTDSSPLGWDVTCSLQDFGMGPKQWRRRGFKSQRHKQ